MEKLTIEAMQEIANRRGGKCLSPQYVNAHTKLKWQCKEGHIWEAMPTNIKLGNWCPKCNYTKMGLEKRLTIEEMQEIATRRGGTCLSPEYIKARTKLKWQCKDGHVWEATPDSVKQGEWCPKCAAGISERICRKIIETIFNEKFPKLRPSWLKNARGNQMELDGYNKRLSLAFEYHGVQHYNYNPFWHKTIMSFEQRKIDDELKRTLCEKKGVILIEIPYSVGFTEIQDYIITQCKVKKVFVPNISMQINYKELDIYPVDRLKKMEEIARQRGGKCLSSAYVNNRTKLKWQCKEGHIWEANPTNIRKAWCPNCAGNVRLSIEEMQEIATQRGGTCLSPEYIDARTKLKWQCKEGHIWEASPYSIKGGSWCPKCGFTKMGLEKRLTIEEMQEIATQHGGK